MSLKVYIMDCGWRGSIVAIAESEIQARELMADELNYDEGNSVSESGIEPGLVWVDTGDM